MTLAALVAASLLMGAALPAVEAEATGAVSTTVAVSMRDDAAAVREDLAGAEDVPAGSLALDNLFSDLDLDEFMDGGEAPAEEQPEVGIGTISLLPGVSEGLASSGAAGEGDPSGSGGDIDGQPGEPGSMSDLLSGSGGFDLDDWMEGFDPDADYGGLGFEEAEGPGSVSVSVLDTDGRFINGIIITEDGFRTDRITYGGVPYEIGRLPLGEYVFGVYLTYSFDIEDVIIFKHETGGGETVKTRVPVDDIENIPPIGITGASLRWEITFILRQRMEIKVSYFLVSPNDRFYYLRYGGGEEGEAVHHVNTFKNAPVRVAVYIEMPSLRNIGRIRLEGKGFGNPAAGGAEKGAGGADQSAGGTGGQWHIEGEYGDFSMPDWTFTDRANQLVSADSVVDPDKATHIRFFILALPEAREGAELRFDKIILTDTDGGETEFSNPGAKNLAVWLVEAPKLL